MAVTLDLVEFTCTLSSDEAATVAFQWTADGSPHTYEVTLKQGGVAIYSHTGTLLSSYAFSNVASGVYDAQVFSIDTGPSNIVNIDIDCSPTTLFLNESHVNPTTIGGSDGTIDLIPSGGYTPYTYLWDDGPTTQDRTGLPAGSYHVTVNSADSQTEDLTIVLTDPAACDLTITAIDIEKESLRRAGDASATITVTTSNVGPIEYSLDNSTWQSSNVLSALSEGDYTVYVRQHACTDSQAFSITRRDPLYYVQYDDRQGKIIRAELLESGFDGTTERLIAGPSPVTIKYQGEGEERYQPIKGSECTVTFQSDVNFKFLPIFTADNRKYRIDVYMSEDGTTFHLDWTGYVLPELYSEPYRMPPYFVQVKAVDGLGMLKYTPFTLDSGSITEFEIVRTIIDTLDLHIPIISSLDIYETQMDQTLDDEPLMQALVNTAVYQKNKKKLDSKAVLEANLQIYYARIFQSKGSIRIVRYDQLRGVYGRRIFDKSGTLLSSGYVNPVLDIQIPRAADPKLQFINDSATLTMKTAYHQVKAVQTYGTEANLITDGDFLPSAFLDSTTLRNWTDTAHIEQREAYPGKYSVAITDNGTTPGFKITSRPVYLYAGASIYEPNKISLKFEYFIVASALGSDSPIVPYQIKIGTQYWTGSAWTSTPTIIEEDPAGVNVPRTVDVGEISVPEDGEFTLTLYAVIPHDFTVTEVQYSNVVGKFLPLGGPPPESVTYEVSQDIPYTFEPDDLAIYHGDTPSPVFASSINIQQVGSSTIVQSTEWKRSTVTEGKKLLQILVESIAADYEVPTQLLQAEILGTYHFGQSFRHAFNSNRVFVPNGATANYKTGIWSGEWLEALEVQPAATVDPEDIEEDGYVDLDELMFTE